MEKGGEQDSSQTQAEGGEHSSWMWKIKWLNTTDGSSWKTKYEVDWNHMAEVDTMELNKWWNLAQEYVRHTYTSWHLHTIAAKKKKKRLTLSSKQRGQCLIVSAQQTRLHTLMLALAWRLHTLREVLGRARKRTDRWGGEQPLGSAQLRVSVGLHQVSSPLSRCQVFPASLLQPCPSAGRRLQVAL